MHSTDASSPFSTPSSGHRERLLWLDAVKILAIFFVIILHLSDPVLSAFNLTSASLWLSSNFYESIAMIAVPLFIVTSGQLILDKDEPLQIFIKKRAKRILLPWIGWTVIYFIWTAYTRVDVTNAVSALNLLSDIFFHYFWFMPLITGVYVMTPIVTTIIKKVPSTVIFYLLCFWFGFVSSKFVFFQGTTSVLAAPNTISGLFFPFLLAVPYMGYFVAGYAIQKLLKYKIHPLLIISVYLLSLLLTFFGTYVSSKMSGTFDPRYLSHFAPNIILETVTLAGFFALLQRNVTFPLGSAAQSAVVTLSNSILGIYLSNKLTTEVITGGIFGYKPDILSFSPIISIPLTALVIFTVSFLLIYCLQKIPLLKFFIA